MDNFYVKQGLTGTYHVLKLDYKYAISVYNGTKTFEIRFNDRGYKVNDLVSFRVVNIPDGVSYQSFISGVIRELERTVYRISYILKGFEGLADGKWVAFSIKKVPGITLG